MSDERQNKDIDTVIQKAGIPLKDAPEDLRKLTAELIGYYGIDRAVGELRERMRA